jgi:hypothetical protein
MLRRSEKRWLVLETINCCGARFWLSSLLHRVLFLTLSGTAKICFSYAGTLAPCFHVGCASHCIDRRNCHVMFMAAN